MRMTGVDLAPKNPFFRRKKNEKVELPQFGDDFTKLKIQPVKKLRAVYRLDHFEKFSTVTGIHSRSRGIVCLKSHEKEKIPSRVESVLEIYGVDILDALELIGCQCNVDISSPMPRRPPRIDSKSVRLE